VLPHDYSRQTHAFQDNFTTIRVFLFLDIFLDLKNGKQNDITIKNEEIQNVTTGHHKQVVLYQKKTGNCYSDY